MRCGCSIWRMVTGGGPGTATEPVSLYAFIALMQRLRFGYGSALSVTVFLLTLPSPSWVRASDARSAEPDREGSTGGRLGGGRRPAPGRVLFPIYWMFVASLMPESRLFESRPLLPTAVTFEHYRALFDERDFLVPIRIPSLSPG